MHGADLTFEVTNSCNLRCKMCNIWAESVKYKLTLQEIGDTIATVKKKYKTISSVSITGGECFLHPNMEQILTLLAKLKKTNVITDFDITSNGFFIEKMKDVFTKNHALLSSVPFQFGFSVDGLEKTHTEQRGNPLSWERVTESIAFLKENYPNVNVVIRFCATVLNYKDILPLYAWSKEQGVTFIPKVAEFNLKSYYQRGPGGVRVDNHTEEMCVHVQDALTTIMNDKESESFDGAIKEIIHFLKEKTYSDTPCSTPMRSLFIDSRGNVFPCVYYDPLTNIRDKNWEQQLFEKEHKRLILLGTSKTCIGCIAYHGALKQYNLEN